MARNQLPDGVGRKIVEALELERQRKAKSEPKSEPEEKENKFEVEAPVNEPAKDDDMLDFIIEEEPAHNEAEQELPEESDEDIMETIPDFVAMEEENLDEDEKPVMYKAPAPEPVIAPEEPEEKEPEPEVRSEVEAPQLKSFKVDTEPEPVEKAFDDSVVTAKSDFTPIQPVQATELGGTIQVPYNVAILNNLIAGLPAGISKQIGAQIIRQTLEATGMSMRKVLKEAQELQEQLNVSARDCMLKIQEYKANILSLEKSVRDYQANISQINELVSLFLITGKK